MTGLISQNCHPFFAEDLLSFQLFSLYSLISLRYLRKQPDLQATRPFGGRKQKYIYLRKKRKKRIKLIRQALARETSRPKVRKKVAAAAGQPKPRKESSASRS